MKPRPVLATLVVIVGLALGAGAYRNANLSKHYLQVQPSMSESEVTALIGKPSKVQMDCNTYSTQLTPNCDHSYIYRGSFAPLRDEYWVVYFGKDGRAVGTTKLDTP